MAFKNMELHYYTKTQKLMKQELENKKSVFHHSIKGLKLFRKERNDEYKLVRKRNFLKHSIAVHDNIMSYFYQNGQKYPPNMSKGLIEDL